MPQTRRMSWIITGGAGFIGSSFVIQALQSGWTQQAIVLDKLTYAGNPANLDPVRGHSGFSFVHGDIGDTALVAKLLEEHQVEAVINFAAETHVDRSIDSPEPFVQTNVIGTLRLLEAARQHWKKMGDTDKARFRFLHVSTDEVFGTLAPEDPAFSETTPYAPNSPYAASKAAADHLVRAYFHTYKMPVLTTNCSNNYGPRQFPEKLVPLMILNALEGKNLPVYGDGQQVRDWLFVEDHCTAIQRVLAGGRPGETYNIGGRSELPNMTVVHTLCDTLDKLCPRSDARSYREQIIFVADRPGHDRRYAINCSKIEKELGWIPSETFATGLQKTVRWYLDNRAWCEAVTREKYQRERLGQA